MEFKKESALRYITEQNTSSQQQRCRQRLNWRVNHSHLFGLGRSDGAQQAAFYLSTGTGDLR